MNKGYCFINTSYFNPKELFPNHEVIYCDKEPERLLYRVDDKDRVIIFDFVPSERIVKNLPYPFIIYTMKNPPDWLRKYVRINDGRANVFIALTKLIRGEEIDKDEEQVIKNNLRFAHTLLVQHLHIIYNKPPSEFGILDKCVRCFNSDLYLKLLKTLIQCYKPDSYPSLRYRKTHTCRGGR